MLKNDLIYEKNQLQLIQKHHLEALSAWDNPSGILLCQRHGNGFRWKRKYIQDGRSITARLSKTEHLLAEKLAVNLYRMICIEYLRKQIASIDNLIRSLHSETEPKPEAETNSEMQKELLQGNLLTEFSMNELLYKVQNRPRVPADFFHPQSPYRPFIISHLEKECTWIISWYLGDFKQNKDHPETLQFPVKLGFNVRSKSEVMEADRMFEEGILFHYEEILLLSDEESYLDFYIPITIIERYCWEHFGAMDKEGYFHRARGKILNYLDHHWLPGINMIATYETRKNPMTEEKVDQQIRWLKNRYRIAFPDLPPDESFNLYNLAADVKYRRSKQ